MCVSSFACLRVHVRVRACCVMVMLYALVMISGGARLAAWRACEQRRHLPAAFPCMQPCFLYARACACMLGNNCS